MNFNTFPRSKRRVTLFCGHYGSGKSTVALNRVIAQRKSCPDRRVALADLDIVNPYFRTADSADLLAHFGISLIASACAGSNVDLPSLPGEAYALTEDREMFAVIDVGGDDRGALALGRYSPALARENDYDMLAVINRFRPLTSTTEDTVTVLREIEAASGLRFTGVVNNSNLGHDTTAEDVIGSMPYALSVADGMGLPLVFTAAASGIAADVAAKVSGEVFPLTYFDTVIETLPEDGAVSGTGTEL